MMYLVYKAPPSDITWGLVRDTRRSIARSCGTASRAKVSQSVSPTFLKRAATCHEVRYLDFDIVRACAFVCNTPMDAYKGARSRQMLMT